MFKKCTVYLLLASLLTPHFSWAGDRDSCWDFSKPDGHCEGGGREGSGGSGHGDGNGGGSGGVGNHGDMGPGDLHGGNDPNPDSRELTDAEKRDMEIVANIKKNGPFLSQPIPTIFSHPERIENIGYAYFKSEELKQLIASASENLPHVTAQMEQGASDYIRVRLKESEAIGGSAVTLAQSGATKAIVQLLAEFAIDTATSINSFLKGVQAGTYGGFVATSEAISVISNNPMLVLNLSKNIVHMISGGPGALAAAAHDAFQYVANEVWEFQVSMSGPEVQRGHALGELGSNVLIAMATGETLPGVKAALEDVGSRVAGNKALGEALNQGMRESPALGPILSATATMIRDGRAAVMRNLEECKAIRTGYRNEMRGIFETAERMLGEGQSEETVARHVHSMRREIGVRFKEKTPSDVRQHIYDRNILDNSDVLGPSIEELRAGRSGKPPKTWKEIIDSSSRSNKNVDLFFDGLGE
jgi:hypothetical protein